MRTVLTPKIEKYILENHLKVSAKSMAKKFNISSSVVSRFYKKNNIKVPVELVKKFRSDGNIVPFTKKEDNFIINNIKEYRIQDFAIYLKRDRSRISKRIKELGLHDFINDRKLNSQYKKGNIPFNKSLTWDEFMPKESQEKCKKTIFNKGHIPHNAYGIGERVLRHQKNNTFYWMIKVPENKKLVYEHIYNWEKENGTKLPIGHNIIFKDGNNHNTNIENLECISNSELMKRNSIHNYPIEIKENILLIGKLKKQIAK